MQDLIGELIRGIGWVLLKVVTAGKYTASERSFLAEGALGLAAIAAGSWMAYALWPW